MTACAPRWGSRGPGASPPLSPPPLTLPMICHGRDGEPLRPARQLPQTLHSLPSGDEGCCTESDLGAHWLFACSQHPGSRPLRQSPWPDRRASRWPDSALLSSSRRRWTPVTVRPPFLQQRRSPNCQRGGGKDTARVPALVTPRFSVSPGLQASRSQPPPL